VKWQIKFLRNAIFGIFPRDVQERLRKIKRALVPYNDEFDLWTLRQGLRQVGMLRRSGCDLVGKNYLEIGTGWSPVIPLIFSLAGCKSLILVDRQRLISHYAFVDTCKNLLIHKEEISRELQIAVSDIESTFSRLTGLSVEAALLQLNIQYVAPFDLLKNNFPDQSLDVITSRAVFEHIPPAVIAKIFRECKRLLRYGGVMCHLIDNSDHWEHGDKSIGRLHFLKYSPGTFRFISSMNPLDYQNRLRHSQYKTMIEDAGFKVICDESVSDAKTLASLDSFKVHPSFTQFTREDMAILSSYLVAKKLS
jgi:SAM-dependent methyltransferase